MPFACSEPFANPMVVAQTPAGENHTLRMPLLDLNHLLPAQLAGTRSDTERLRLCSPVISVFMSTRPDRTGPRGLPVRSVVFARSGGNS